MKETAKKVYLPEKVANAVANARYHYKKSPDRMLKFVLNRENPYIEDWLTPRQNMAKLVDTLYSHAEIIPTPDFIYFEDAAKSFIDGQAFCVYHEEDTVPFLVLTYSEEDKCIYELIEDSEGEVTLSNVKNPIHGDSIRYSKQETTKTPFDFMRDKHSFFMRHFTYGGKAE